MGALYIAIDGTCEEEGLRLLDLRPVYTKLVDDNRELIRG